jgi:hypothetical protein
VDKGWITKSSGQRLGTNIHNEYRLQFYPSGDDVKRDWIRLDRMLFDSGVWGFMRPSERRIYLLFRAMAWAGRSAVPDGYVEDDVKPIEVEAWGKWRKFHHSEVQFLPNHIYNPADFRRLSGVKERAFRVAIVWLHDNDIIIPYEHLWDNAISGFIIPFSPKIYFPDVQLAVKKAKDESAARKVSSGAKRSLTAIHRRTALRKTAA